MSASGNLLFVLIFVYLLSGLETDRLRNQTETVALLLQIVEQASKIFVIEFIRSVGIRSKM